MAGTPTIHELKIWRRYFEAVVDGSKTFEVRRDDKQFEVGDLIDLREWIDAGDDSSYSGRRVTVRVTYVMKGRADNPIQEGYVILAIRKEN
jgi:ASC-1-like (ASCH) protein